MDTCIALAYGTRLYGLVYVLLRHSNSCLVDISTFSRAISWWLCTQHNCARHDEAAARTVIILWLSPTCFLSSGVSVRCKYETIVIISTISVVRYHSELN